MLAQDMKDPSHSVSVIIQFSCFFRNGRKEEFKMVANFMERATLKYDSFEPKF